uniref:Insulin-like domain-containing protein n=1 Tax=Tetranychus urticae TaxID=32264 RepID=T1K3G0_TETUR
MVIKLNVSFVVIQLVILFLSLICPSHEENLIRVCTIKELQSARSRICSLYKRSYNPNSLMNWIRERRAISSIASSCCSPGCPESLLTVGC